MGQNGGARPGAGRKPKADKHAGVITRAEKRIADKLPTLIDKMMELAHGVTVQEVDKEGGLIVYTKAPDRQAAEYLINRIMGKPTERKEVTGPEGGPVEVAFYSYDAVAGELSDE
jgi:hypothetical protein